jgi:hypothetical protein
MGERLCGPAVPDLSPFLTEFFSQEAAMATLSLVATRDPPSCCRQFISVDHLCYPFDCTGKSA